MTIFIIAWDERAVNKKRNLFSKKMSGGLPFRKAAALKMFRIQMRCSRLQTDKREIAS